MTPAYLILPYSHTEKLVREIRAIQADRAAAHLIERGYNVFSPISHSHRVANYLNKDNDSEFWCALDDHWQRQCAVVFVLMLSGWKSSAGVYRELMLACELRQNIYYLDPITLEITNA